MSKFEAEFGPLLSKRNPIEIAANQLGPFAYLLGYSAEKCFDEIRDQKLTDEIAKKIWIAREEIKDIDKLTGLTNKNQFDRNLERRVEESARLPLNERSPIAVSFSDINGMKAYNTRFGHDYTDEIIRFMANLMAANYRDYDVIARRSGDEFLALQPHADIQIAMNSALRSQVTIKDNTPQLARYLGRQLNQEITDLDLSLSIGVTELDYFNNDSADQITKRAGSAMYTAKTLVHADSDIQAIGLSKSTDNESGSVTMAFTYMKKDCRPEMLPELMQEVGFFIKKHRRAWILDQIPSVRSASMAHLASNYEYLSKEELDRLYDRINKPTDSRPNEYH